jgi:hypothetical protein
MDEDLNSILSNDKPPVEAAPVVEQKDDKPVAEVVETKDDTAAPSAAKEAIQPTETKKEPLKPAELAAIIDERRKRQEAERELAELKGSKTEAPDFFADPEKAVEAKVQQIVAPIREKFFKQSITTAASAHTDFEQAAEVFAGMVEADPALRSQWLADDDPGEFIYRAATNTPAHREKFASELKSQLSAKDAEIAALKAELEGKSKAQAELSAVPKSLNNVASGVPKAADTQDDDIASIVRFKTG